MSVLLQTDLVELHLGNARDFLPSFRTESVDLVVTDPPYGVEYQSNMRAESFDRIANDGAADREGISQIIGECVRLVGQHRHIYVFGPADVLAGHKVSEAVEIIWDKGKPGMGDLSAAWAPAHERITFATSKHRHAGESGKANLPTRMRKGSVLKAFPPTGRKVRHPTEKPLELLRELIESSSRPGDLVLDPFVGSGSTGVAAILSGRRALLVEIDPNYAQIAVDRLTKAESLWQQMRQV